jgi:ATP-dependent RNA helicase DeaD
MTGNFVALQKDIVTIHKLFQRWVKCAIELPKPAEAASAADPVATEGGSSPAEWLKKLAPVNCKGAILGISDMSLLDMQRLDNLKTMVFDEADEMMDMGFKDEIDRVVKVVPKDRQTIFFSATLSGPIKHLIESYTTNPVWVKIEHKALTVPTIEQRYYEVNSRSKVEVLCRLLDIENPRLAILFANTKRMVDDVTDALMARGFAVDRLHGDLNQTLRDRVM